MEASLTGTLSSRPEFDKIDWSAPWLEDWRELASIGEGWREALNARAIAMDLRNASGLPVQFVEQSVLPEGVAYEAFIHEAGGVPTRANLHDFFNALIWLSYPRIKRSLNAIQAHELATAGVNKTRGSTRDAATLFDENAVLFACADPALAATLRAHEWESLFIDKRASFGEQYAVFPFGHALLEKLTSPFKAITAHAWVVEVDTTFFQLPRLKQLNQLDEIVALQLQAGLPGVGFTPLPVLGVPGWATGQDASYYQDQTVFRPKRNRTNLEH